MHPSIITALCLKAILVAIGVPANALMISRVLLGSVNSGHRLTRIEFMTVNLCVVDLLILLGYNSSIIAHIVTREFQGTVGVCKTLQFFLASCFTFCSFNCAGIALERVLRVYALSGSSRDERLKRAKFIIACAWVFALIVNLPHFFVYTTIKMGAAPRQCTTVFQANKLNHCYQQFRAFRKWSRSNHTTNDTQTFSWKDCVSAQRPEEDAITVSYLLILFWIPALVITVCNLAICLKIFDPCSLCGLLPGHLPLSNAQRATRSARTVVIWRTVRLTICYVILWLPHNIMEVVKLTNPEWYFPHFSYIAFTTDLITVNAVVNPFIYRPTVTQKRKSTREKQGDALTNLIANSPTVHSGKSFGTKRNTMKDDSL